MKILYSFFLVFFLSCISEEKITEANVNQYVDVQLDRYEAEKARLFPLHQYFIGNSSYPSEFNDYSNAVIQRLVMQGAETKRLLKKAAAFKLEESGEKRLELFREEDKKVNYVLDYWYHFNFLSPLSGGHLEVLNAMEEYPRIKSDRDLNRLLVFIEDSKRKLRSLKNRLELKAEKKIYFSSFSSPLILASLENIEANFEKHRQTIIQRVDFSSFDPERHEKIKTDITFYLERFYLKYLRKIRDTFKSLAKKEGQAYDKKYLRALSALYEVDTVGIDPVKIDFKSDYLKKYKFNYNTDYFNNLIGVNSSVTEKLKMLFPGKEKAEKLVEIEKALLENKTDLTELAFRLEAELKLTKDDAFMLLQIMDIHPGIFAAL